MPTLPFAEYYVDQAPEARGVFCLFENGVLIGVGHAAGAGVSIRSCLRSHLLGLEGPCSQKATHFTWKITACPSTTLWVWITQYPSAPQDFSFGTT